MQSTVQTSRDPARRQHRPFRLIPRDPRKPDGLILSPDDFSYREDGVIDIGGRLAVPPLQWYLPGPTASLLYTTQTWLVDGELLGKHVRGFLFWEQAWMLPGARLYAKRIRCATLNT